MSDQLLVFDPCKPVSLPGRRCAYCGITLTTATRSDDHVVGRRFVPDGALASGFFLKVKACKVCNSKKASLEDDISLTTMLPDTAGRYSREDERLKRTVRRKSNGAISTVTRRPVVDSYNKITAIAEFDTGMSINFDGVAMPSLDEQRVARLAFYHVQGFVHFRSYSNIKGHGKWLEPSQFLLFDFVIKDDWGNPHIQAFSELTRRWEPECIAILADGYFRHEMRKMHGFDLWSWAVEWNDRVRVYGLYGTDLLRSEFAGQLPRFNADLSLGNDRNGFAIRYDTPLADSGDLLFTLPEDLTERPIAQKHWGSASARGKNNSAN